MGIRLVLTNGLPNLVLEFNRSTAPFNKLSF